MDNQMFPGGGAFLDDVAQVCTLCGMMFNNALTYQHHMQLHILSANAQMLGSQPPPDPGISMPAAANILDLMGGVSQHTLSTGAGVALVPPQAVFSAAGASTIPPHLISPGAGLVAASVPNIGLPQQQRTRMKEKKSKTSNVKPSTGSNASNLHSSNPGQRKTGSGIFKSPESSSSTYISTFPKDLQKMEHASQKSKPIQPTQTKTQSDVFSASSAQVDPLEALILTSPVKHGAQGFERQSSRKSPGSPQDSTSVNKESRKLFQPFVVTESQVNAGFVTKSHNQFNADTLISPIKTGSGKTPLMDVLSTPQKISYHNSTENLFSSPTPLPSTSGDDIRNFGMFQDSEMASLPLDRKSDLPTKVDSHDKLAPKTQYFSESTDPLNMSPQGVDFIKTKDVDTVKKMPVHQNSLDHSRSSSPLPHDSSQNDFTVFKGESSRTIVSPKVTPALPSGVLNTDSAPLSSKPHHFGGTATDIIPTASVPSTTQGFAGSHTSDAGNLSVLANPAIDIAVNPLGTGYFNALTQKFIDPTFSIGTDFNKSSLSAQSSGQDDQKQKIYFENGVIMNQDYDKISDTNDEDNLERLIDDIDSKSDNNIDKGYSEIEDLLNEFNEKQIEDMKNKNQIEDFMKNDDFLKNVIEDSSKTKSDNISKVDESTFNPPEEFEMNKSIISDILEKEKERIEKESTEMENARLSGLMNSSTTTSTSVAVSSSALTSTVTSVSSSEPKVSTSAESAEKKDDDPADFEIPKVGKLMKIRKYFQIQEQKRKEQTEKVSEVRVYEKNETNPPDDKPQTILVQVSKRKKIEYGPYLNRQSLLEGKPKANLASSSPPKASRPKPKPPLPEKRTFNLRERKTKTDFATLASTGSKTAEAKKTDSKHRIVESCEKNENEKEDKEELTEKKVENQSEDHGSKDKEMIHSSEKKEVSLEVEKTKSKTKESDSQEESKLKDLKVALRTRSARNETDITDGKNLRKRTIKSSIDNQSSSKVKVKKTDESVLKPSTELEEKITRSKSKLKATPEKTEIKKCSVNLGEKYNESKAKSCIEKSESKSEKSIHLHDNDSHSKKNQETKVEVSECLVIPNNSGREKTQETEMKLVESDTATNIEELSKKQDQSFQDLNFDDSVKEDLITDDIQSDSSNVYPEKLKGELKLISKHVLKGREIKGRKGNKTRSSKRETNIFDKIEQSECTNQEISEHKTDESQIVSITSTDNTDKKVTMKLKLGPNFQKAFDFFNPKKRKHESIETGSEIQKEVKKEQKLSKKSKEMPENEKGLDSKSALSLKEVESNSVSQKECTILKEEKNVKGNVEVKSDSCIRTDCPSIMSETDNVNTEGQKEEIVSQNIAEYEKNLQESTKKSVANNCNSEMNKVNELKEENTRREIKHSVENEFQRLVNEAMAEAQKEGDTTKSKNLRKRMKENVKYNVDESDDELDKLKFLPEYFMTDTKIQKSMPKGWKAQTKSSLAKGKLKSDTIGFKENDASKQQQPKKDVDVYDFTDTEMSESEESTPQKLGFKPKYVSNLNLFGQKKLPFVSKPMSPLSSNVSDSQVEEHSETPKQIIETDDTGVSGSFIGKTVEPLKIKLSKIIPFKEKKHKHKKKKRKRDKEKRDDEIERYDSESRDSAESGGYKRVEEDFHTVEGQCESENAAIKKIEEINSVESIGQESNSNSNEGDDDQNETGSSAKSNKRGKIKEKKHICEYCNVGFGQKCDLRRHVMIHTGERPYPCEICDKRFQRKTDLVKHTRTHTGEKPYACEFCDKRVSDKSQLNVHRRLHTGDRPYCCSKCGKRCITSSELSRHKAVHCGEKVERCKLCKKAFTVKECLGMHMKLHYRGRGKSFKCEKCAIGFDRKADLDSHHCVDPMKNVYVCSECYEEFCDEMLYAEHIKTHDLGVLACNVCTNIFEDKHSLETHLCTLGMEKQKQFACDICEAEFQDQDLLNKHLTAHDNETGSFMCDLCPEIFTVRNKLAEHSKQHNFMPGKLITSSVGHAVATEDSLNTASSQSSYHLSERSSKIDDKSVDAIRSIIKQEVDRDPYGFFKSATDVKGPAFVDVKTEIGDGDSGFESNRIRASVISGTFRIDDEGSDSKQTDSQDIESRGGDTFTHETGKNHKTSSNIRSPDFLASDRFFEPSDFSNSPDFSTLTEGDVLDLNPFRGISDPLQKESGKGMKMTPSTHSKQIDKSASLDMKQKIMKQIGPPSQSSGTVEVSESRRLVHQSSMESLPMQNSQISAFLSSETTTTNSSSSSQLILAGQFQRSLSTGQSSVFSNPLNNPRLGNENQPILENKRWLGSQISASDFINSFLGENKSETMEYESKSYGIKSDTITQSISKNIGRTVASNNRSDMFSKDNIENQLKSDLFSDLNITPGNQKSGSSLTIGSFKQNNYGDNSSGVFHGVNPNSFFSQQIHQNFPEKSDFSPYGQQFVSPFSQTSSYSSNVSSRSMKPTVAPDSYTLDSNVTPDINKRHIQGMYSGRSDAIQNSSFYLSGVEDSLKDMPGSDKDETTALLSNFDQF